MQLRDAGHDPRLAGVLAQPGEAAGRPRLVDRARDDEAGSRPCSSAQSAVIRAPLLLAGLDDDRRVGQAADEPVAARERASRSASCPATSSETTAPPCATIRRRGSRGPAGTAGRGPSRGRRPSAALGRDGRGVGRAVDPDREAGDDDRPGLRDRRADPRGDQPAALGRAARPDDRRPRARPTAPRRRRGRTGRAAAARSPAAGPGRPASSSVRIATPAAPDPASTGAGSAATATIACRDRRRPNVSRPSFDAGRDERAARRRGRRPRSRIARPVPNAPSSAPKPDRPEAVTDTRTAHASRSSGRRLGLARRIGCAGSSALAVGPDVPTPSTQLASRAPRRAAGDRNRAASSRCSPSDRRRAGEVGDRPGDAQQPLRAAAAQPLEIRELDRPREPRPG